jgi:hypothetical protein
MTDKEKWLDYRNRISMGIGLEGEQTRWVFNKALETIELKRVYVLYVFDLEDTNDDGVYAVYLTREKAEEKGKELIDSNKNDYASYHVTNFPFFK